MKLLITYTQDGITANTVTNKKLGNWLLHMRDKWPDNPIVILFACELDISAKTYEDLRDVL